MTKPKIIVLSGYGLNCEEETKAGFDLAGGFAEIVHVNNVIEGNVRLQEYQIMAIPGGFAFGDHTGSGKAYANRIKNRMWETVQDFISSDKLVLGICNGFQILTNLKLLPGALTYNDSARYINRWIDLKVTGKGPWLQNTDTFSAPVAHGEGKFYVPEEMMKELKSKNMIALTYTKGKMHDLYDLPPNPNGALVDVAGITDETGKIFGLMPHPDRALFFTQLPHWTLLREKYQREGKKLPTYGPGLQIFKNGVQYFS